MGVIRDKRIWRRQETFIIGGSWLILGQNSVISCQWLWDKCQLEPERGGGSSGKVGHLFSVGPLRVLPGTLTLTDEILTCIS